MTNHPFLHEPVLESRMTDASPALVMERVRKTYDVAGEEVVALDRIDLIVEADEIVALVGPSGSGKTTLCSIAGGLLAPTDGRVVVGGDDISDYSSRRLTDFRRSSVGFVFQTVNLVPFLTARENLLVVDELAGRRRRRSDAARRADQLLGELGLTDRAGNLPSQLSGGQRQRVAIGRALMNDPALVLFDEPTSALDSRLGDQVVKLIRDEMKARGTSAIIVTHDDRIVHYADRTVRIEDGRISPLGGAPSGARSTC
jgi:putative ABC transport system ATP-binding protein